MKNRVTYYVIARALAPVAISCRQFLACGIPDTPVQAPMKTYGQLIAALWVDGVKLMLCPAGLLLIGLLK